LLHCFHPVLTEEAREHPPGRLHGARHCQVTRLRAFSGYWYIYIHAAVECMEAWNSLVWAEAFDWVSSMLGNLQNSMCLIVISFVYHCDSFPRGGVTRGWQSQFIGMEVKWSEYLWNSMSIMGTVPTGTPVLFCMRACWLKYLFLHGRE
jgi:hypothetical protein